MSDSEKLLQYIYPAEMQYKHLWEVTTWGKKFKSVDDKKQKTTNKYKYFLASELDELVREDGTVKILTSYKSDKWTEEKLVSQYVSNAEIVCIPSGGNPIVQYYNGPFISGYNHIATVKDPKQLNAKYLYYCIESKLPEIGSYYRGSGIKQPDMSKVLEVKIPIPSIDRQEEIVKALDIFSEIEFDYNTGIPAEINLVTKQSEYWKEYLLDFSRNA